MTHTFEYSTPGKTKSFEDFNPTAGHTIGCRLPETGTRRGRYISARLFVTEKDYLVARKGYGITPGERQEVRVGVLTESTSHPMPKGIYIPYTLNNYGEATHAMDDLIGDYIFNEQVRDKAEVLTEAE